MHIETRFFKFLNGSDLTRNRSRKTGYSRFFPSILTVILTLLLLLPSISCVAQVAASPVSANRGPENQGSEQMPMAQTTLTIFNDQPMPEGLWPALVTALREELASGVTEIRALAGTDPVSGIQIIRGDQIAPGITVDNAITFYLHGNCVTTPTPQPDLFGQPQTSGALGWVQMDDGHIDPFVHVECKRIGQMLGLQGIGRNRDQRNRLMAVAITRVMLHEWMHVATQDPHHSKHGIFKAEFSVADLMARSPKPGSRQDARLHDSAPNSCDEIMGQDVMSPQAQSRIKGSR